MRDRLILGPVLIAALIGALALDDALAGRALPFHAPLAQVPRGLIIFAVMLTAGIIASRELAVMLKANGVLASRRILSLASIMGLLVSCIVPTWVTPVEAVAAVGTAGVLVLAVALGFYSRHKTVEGVVAAAGGAMLSFVYLGLMFGFLLAIRREHSAWILLWVLLVTKACDIGALFAGKAIGRHKLIPWLSPGKTWEGLAGGIVLACAVSVAGLWVIERQLGLKAPPVALALIPGVLFAVVGQAGDLLESLFKRDAGLKDSGQWLPGFGGMLDLMDSPLLVAPLAYWTLHALSSRGWLIPGG